MKKIIILFLCCINIDAFTQSKNIQNAYNAYRQERDGVKIKMQEAKEFIDLAYNHESTSNDAKMWNYRAKIYLEIMQNHPDIDPGSVFKATESHIRCLDKDKKGKSIVRKWTREEEVLDGLVQCGYKLFNLGVEDYNNQNYTNAIKKYEEIFRIIPLDKDNLLKRGNIVPESIYKNLYLASLRLEDIDAQIEYLQKAIDLNTNDPQIYYFMSNAYLEKGDLDQALNYIQEGKEMFDSEVLLINTEIDLLMKMGKSTQEIIDKLSEAIEIDNLNEILFIIRSQLYVQEKMFIEAESDLLSALDLNPQSLSANNNIASLYLTMTEPIVKEVNETSYRNTKKIDMLQEDINNLHKKALPYLKKYIDLKESEGEHDKSALNTLATLYYGLGMEKESIETRKRLNQIK